MGNEHAGAQGVGVDANYTPVGFNNANASYDGTLGSHEASMENAVIGQMSGSLEGGQTDDGTNFGRASWAPGRT